MDRLWLAACWRKPWQGAPRLILPEHYALGLEAVAEVGEKHDLKRMATLPPEIVQMIRSFCDTSLFWKLASALDLCHRFHATSTSDLTTMSLDQVVEWRRYAEVAASDSPDLPPFLRITIDSRGVSSLDRIDSALSDDFLPRDNESYIIQDVASCKDIEVVIKVCMLVPLMPRGLLLTEV